MGKEERTDSRKKLRRGAQFVVSRNEASALREMVAFRVGERGREGRGVEGGEGREERGGEGRGRGGEGEE